MAFPTTFLRAPAIGLHGQLANMTEAEVISGVAQNANVAVGVAVSWVSADKDDAVRVGCVAQASPFLVSPSFRGIAILDVTRPLSATASNPYLQTEGVSVLREGVVYLSVAGAVTMTDVVTADTTTGVIGNTAADATHARLPAQWDSSTTGAGIARLRLNNPSAAI